MKRYLLLLLLVVFATLSASAQRTYGRVLDAKSGEAVPFANVFYDNGKGSKRGVQSDAEGRFSLPTQRGARLVVSSVGYESYTARPAGGDSLIIRLKPADFTMSTAVVKAKRSKYSRKNNPAVILMEKVIAAKKAGDLKRHDFYSFEKYNKLTFALSDITPKFFEEGGIKKMPFLKEHVETSSETGKLILPVSVDETVSQEIYSKELGSTKSIIKGERTTGMNEILNTGEILATMMQDIFTEVDIYKDDIRFLQAQFLSPVASHGAIAFYRYFIEDTTVVDGRKCIQVSFSPNNPRDFGFTGSLYVLADSTFRIAKADIGIPIKSTVNFVKRINITQEFATLPSGEQVLAKNDLFAVLELVKFLKTVEVKRYTEFTNYSFAPLSKRLFRFTAATKTEPDARMQNEAFWKEHRPLQLSPSEDRLSLFVHRIYNIKGISPFIWVGKSIIENTIPTSIDEKNPSKIDIGPVNTIVTSNPVDGLRLRASLQTTANLNPHMFWRGYLAYGFRDKRWKGLGEVTYSFRRKAYLPMEFPVSNLTFTYSYDVSVPSDQYLTTDKDNVFMALKWASVKHMTYDRAFKLVFDREWDYGLQYRMQLRHDLTEPTYHLFYQPVKNGILYDADGRYNPRPFGPADGANYTSHNRKYLSTTDLSLLLQYQPGVAYINTKQRRILVNKEAPIYRISHLAGLRGAWSDFTYNLTEIGIRKRVWLRSWGRMDFDFAAGAQWNRVPFPLLIMPRANLAYVYDDDMYYLVDNMEFLNDRYAQLMFNWTLNGKIFNRIPLLNRLKWREHVGFNMLWGRLTDKNNPYLEQNKGRNDLFFFPGEFRNDGSFRHQSRIMNPERPYIEAAFGIHNIFKLFHIDYVRRFTYIDDPRTTRWGIRFMARVIF